MRKQNLRYMKWIGKMIILLFILNFQFSIFNCSAQRVSLDECLEKALESNFSIKIIRNEARMDKNNLNYSTFLPTLEGTAKQTQTRNDTKTENSVGEVNKMSDVKTDNYTAGVALNWRIFDGLEMFTTHEKQKELLAMGELAVQQAVENLILNEMCIRDSSLRGNDNLLIKMKTLKVQRQFFDEDLVEDVEIELRQAQDSARIYSDILSGTMDAYASVISNNLNIVMKRMTSISIILMLPTLIASLYGMNVPNSLEENPYGFLIVIVISILFSVFGFIVFKWRHWF